MVGHQERTGLCHPAVLAVAGPVLACASAGVAVLLGRSWQQAAILGLVVPWSLAAALGLRVLAAGLSERRRRARAPRPLTVDLRERARPLLPLPRQDRQPLDDVPKRGRGAP